MTRVSKGKPLHLPATGDHILQTPVQGTGWREGPGLAGSLRRVRAIPGGASTCPAVSTWGSRPTVRGEHLYPSPKACTADSRPDKELSLGALWVAGGQGWHQLHLRCVPPVPSPKAKSLSLPPSTDRRQAPFPVLRPGLPFSGPPGDKAATRAPVVLVSVAPPGSLTSRRWGKAVSVLPFSVGCAARVADSTPPLSPQSLSQLLARRALWSSPLSVLPMVWASAYHTLNSASISPQGGGRRAHSETGEAIFLSCLLIPGSSRYSPLPLVEAGIYPLASGCPSNLPVLFNKWNQTSPLKRSLCSPRLFSEGHQKRPQRPLPPSRGYYLGWSLPLRPQVGGILFWGVATGKRQRQLEMAAAPGQTGILHSSFSVFAMGTSGPPRPPEKPGGAQKGCRGWEVPPDSH